jgi:hypothetical protein
VTELKVDHDEVRTASQALLSHAVSPWVNTSRECR